MYKHYAGAFVVANLPQPQKGKGYRRHCWLVMHDWLETCQLSHSQLTVGRGACLFIQQSWMQASASRLDLFVPRLTDWQGWGGGWDKAMT